MHLRNAASAFVLPLLVSSCTSAQVVGGQAERPFTPGNPVAVTSPIDLSFLNEPVAGATGRVRRSADGQSFVRGDGQPLRFWAVVTDIWQKSPQEMEDHAKFLARMGVNMIRIHAQIPGGKGSLITDVDEKGLDNIRRFVSVCKKHGIYSTISPYWGHSQQAAKWGLTDYEKDDQELYGLLFFEPKLQAAYRTWVKKLYNDPNPYTGVPLAKEPAVAIVQVQNEDSLLFWTTGALKPTARAKLAGLFTTWAVAKYGSIAKAKAAWPGANQAGDTANRFALLDHWMLVQDNDGGTRARADDQAWFYANQQRNFYAGIATYFRNDLGYTGLMNATNWITADATRLGDLERWSYGAMDVAATNRYYDGGYHVGPNNGWRIDVGDKVASASAVLNYRDQPMNLRQPAGQPMIITESAWVWPMQHQSEGPLLSAARMSLNGVDALYWFDASAPAYETDFNFRFITFPDGGHPTNKWSGSTPQQMGMFPAAALMFRRGDLKEAEDVLHEARPVSDLAKRKKPLLSEDKSYDPNRDGGSGTGQNDSPVSPLAFLAGPVRADFAPGAVTTQKPASAYSDPANTTVTSLTGEVVTNYGTGRMTFNSPRAQGFVGVPGFKPISLTDVKFISKDSYANMAVVSMDGLPIKTSKKIMVQFGGSARLTGWTTRPVRFAPEQGKPEVNGFEVTKTGELPWQLDMADCTVIINNAGLKKMTVILDSGAAGRVIPLKPSEGRTSLTFPKDALWVLLEG